MKFFKFIYAGIVFFILVSLSYVQSSLLFDSQNSTLFLTTDTSSMRVKTPHLYGWVDGSLRRKISDFGSYDILSLDTDNNKNISYLETFPDEFMYSDFTLSDSTIQHVQKDMVYDLHGRSMTVGDNAQLFVDNNVTLTIRNATIRYTRLSSDIPPIRLASFGSKLALDNVTIELSQNFNFPQGQLFIHNQVNMIGSAAFLYRSPMVSWISSGAALHFDLGTTFSVAPVTFTDAPYTLKNTYTDCNFIKMIDSTSAISFNGATLATTQTGLRLTKGALLLDNVVNFKSNTASTIVGFGDVNVPGYGAVATSVSWSPDGRYLAVGGEWADSNKYVQVFSFNGNSFVTLSNPGYGDKVDAVSWSPDGQYLAVGGRMGISFGTGEQVKVYKFDGNSFTAINLPAFYGYAFSLSWSSDGRYLAVAGQGLQVFSFNGRSFVPILNPYPYSAYAASWSPDGKHLAVGAYTGSSEKTVKIYNVDGSSFIEVADADFDRSVLSLSWSPDGRYLAVGGADFAKVYRFDGESCVYVADPGFGNNVRSLCWSPDGRYLAIGGDLYLDALRIYRFDGVSFTSMTRPTFEAYPAWSVSWSSDGHYLAAAGIGYPMNIGVFPCTLGSDIVPQALSQSIIFGDKSKGADYDVNLNLLSNAQVQVQQGTVVYDSVH